MKTPKEPSRIPSANPPNPFRNPYKPIKCNQINYHFQYGKTLALLSVYSSGRNEKYFPNPEAFLPERWSRTSGGVQDPYGSLPFGHGKRACVGRRLAEAQMYMLLCKVLIILKQSPKQSPKRILIESKKKSNVDEPCSMSMSLSFFYHQCQEIPF